MKPVPFAEYLARHQAGPLAGAAPAAQPSVAPAVQPPVQSLAQPTAQPTASWPPPRQRGIDEKAARMSPLLRKTESPRPQALPDEDARSAQTPKLERNLLKAFEEGREATRREWAEERARLKEEISEQVALEREKWAQAEGERLLAAHRAAMADFEARCAQAVANILRPFLTQAVIARVTDSLVQNIEVLFASRKRSLFEISGPQDLLDALKQKFSDRPASIAYSLSDGVDVRVRVDETVIETQLGAWMQALGALAAADAAAETPEEKPPARRRTRAKTAANAESAE